MDLRAPHVVPFLIKKIPYDVFGPLGVPRSKSVATMYLLILMTMTHKSLSGTPWHRHDQSFERARPFITSSPAGNVVSCCLAEVKFLNELFYCVQRKLFLRMRSILQSLIKSTTRLCGYATASDDVSLFGHSLDFKFPRFASWLRFSCW